MLVLLLGTFPVKLFCPCANSARCEPSGFRCERSEFMLRHTRVECLDVNVACLFKGVASVALGVASGLRLEGTFASVIHIAQGDLPLRIFRPTSDRPGIDTESLCDGIDIS